MKGVRHYIEDDLEDLECACGLLARDAEEMLRKYAAFERWLELQDDPAPP